MKATSVVLTAAASAASFVNAQQPAWGQCGGAAWTGKTSCVSGYVCQYSNPYYSQCVPGADTSRPSSTSTKASSSSSSKTTTSSTKSSTTLATSTSTKPTAISTSTNSGSVPSSTGIEYLISFGDSYSQTGFDPTLSLASASNPLGNPTFPGWTTSGGPNWIGDYITQYNSSPVYSYNFASGGATTDAKLVTPFAPTVLSFVDQVNLYLKSAQTPGFVKWDAADSIFAIWIGVNDVGNAWYSSTWTTLLGQIMDQYINQTQTLYDSGARRFLFLTVPPIQLSPSVQGQGAATVAAEGAAVKQYNDALKSRITAFAAANPKAKTYVVDTTTPFMTAIDDPKAYGADNATCFDESGTKCLWWNDYHPALAIHKLVAQAVSESLHK